VVFADATSTVDKRVAAEIGASALFVEAHMRAEAGGAAFVQPPRIRSGLEVLVNKRRDPDEHTVVEAQCRELGRDPGREPKGTRSARRRDPVSVRAAEGARQRRVGRSVTAWVRDAVRHHQAAVAGLTREWRWIKAGRPDTGETPSVRAPISRPFTRSAPASWVGPRQYREGRRQEQPLHERRHARGCPCIMFSLRRRVVVTDDSCSSMAARRPCDTARGSATLRGT